MNFFGLGLLAVTSAGSPLDGESELNHVGAFFSIDPITIQENWRQATDYVSYVKSQEALMKANCQEKLWQEWLAEAEWCRIVWYYADDLARYSVTQSYLDPEIKRQKLSKAMSVLKRHLSPEDYRAGRLPPPWPIWIFTEIK